MRYLASLMRYRDLLFWLAAKDIRVRYKSPLLGLLWSLLVPLAVSLILYLVFTYVLPVPTTQTPFFLFLIAGMFPWNFFASCVSQATMSVLEAGPLIRKSPFPRVLVPLALVASNLINFLFALAVALGLVLAMRQTFSPWLWLLPIAVALEVLLTIGMALLVASLQVYYRDVKYVTDIGLLLWFYITPVFYPLTALAHSPPLVRILYVANPFVHLIELFRVALLGVPPTGGFSISGMLSLGAMSCVSVCLLGVVVFRRLEPGVADLVLG